MTLWWALIVALFIQEGVSVAAVLADAYHKQYSPALITTIWFVGTLLQIVLGYYLGKWIQNRFADTKFERWLHRLADRLQTVIGKSGESVALIIVTMTFFPAALTALLASWLEISFTRIIIFATIGDFLWYLAEWVTVLGLSKVFTNFKVEFIFIIVFGLVVGGVSYIMHKRKQQTS